MAKVFFKNRQKEKLVGILEGDGPKCVIMLHGFTGNKDEWGRFERISEILSGKDFCVLRFDFSGNGESEGRFEEAHYGKETDDALSAIAFMKKRGCTSIGLHGHSMGGAVAILAASKEKVNAVAVTAPSSLPIPERLARYAREWVGKKLPPEFLENIASTNVLAAAEKINAPLLIVHGDNDTIIPVDDSKILYNHAKEPRKLVVVPNLDHDFGDLKAADETVREIVEWFQKYL
ncbi:MAG: alpha/beta fold hydrolase [Candidatus Woesearchaeota archaeon]